MAQDEEQQVALRLLEKDRDHHRVWLILLMQCCHILISTI